MSKGNLRVTKDRTTLQISNIEPTWDSVLVTLILICGYLWLLLQNLGKKNIFWRMVPVPGSGSILFGSCSILTELLAIWVVSVNICWFCQSFSTIIGHCWHFIQFWIPPLLTLCWPFWPKGGRSLRNTISFLSLKFPTLTALCFNGQTSSANIRGWCVTQCRAKFFSEGIQIRNTTNPVKSQPPCLTDTQPPRKQKQQSLWLPMNQDGCVSTGRWNSTSVSQWLGHSRKEPRRLAKGDQVKSGAEGRF